MSDKAKALGLVFVLALVLLFLIWVLVYSVNRGIQTAAGAYAASPGTTSSMTFLWDESVTLTETVSSGVALTAEFVLFQGGEEVGREIRISDCLPVSMDGDLPTGQCGSEIVVDWGDLPSGMYRLCRRAHWSRDGNLLFHLKHAELEPKREGFYCVPVADILGLRFPAVFR